MQLKGAKCKLKTRVEKKQQNTNVGKVLLKAKSSQNIANLANASYKLKVLKASQEQKVAYGQLKVAKCKLKTRVETGQLKIKWLARKVSNASYKQQNAG